MKIAIYALYMCFDGGGGAKRALVLAEGLARHHDVSLAIGGTDRIADLERLYNVDLRGVSLVRLSRPWLPLRVSRTLERIHAAELRRLGADVFFNCTWGSTLPAVAPRGVYMCMFPHGRRFSDGGVFGSLANPLRRSREMPSSAVDTYDVITANSQFTARWIGEYWQREAQVVYSAGEDMGPPGTKEKIILHVGRFVDPTRLDHKHQPALLDLFRRMPDLVGQGWQLHLAGSLRAAASRPGFWADVRRNASDLPVFFHDNAPFGDLRSLYRRASIYWHATGFGSDASVYPERQEHFGLTTVEAMSAGAVPVVIGTGGQCEIVEPERTGFRWQTLGELADSTRRLVVDDKLRTRLAAEAVIAAKQFSREAFVARVARVGDIPLPGVIP